MKTLLQLKYIPHSLAGLVVLIIVLLTLMPSEKTLGSLIKLVFLHGALVQAGLLGFAVSGILGLLYLLRKKALFFLWCLSVQKATVILWILYCLSSIAVTYLAWGVAIAWEEPRVQASAKILLFCVVFLILTLWLHHKIFTAVVNIIMAVLAWSLVKSAIVIQHPYNPIRTSDSIVFQFYFLAIFVLILLMVLQAARLFNYRHSI
ncbi:hypothetical protein JXQ31_08985 [candidate division KSB1 bacterium]|nr:hypothetical protein [candidate division KSB1 bacterium]